MRGKKVIRTNRRLTDDLILPDLFSHKLRYRNFAHLLEDLKGADEGYNANGISHFCERISSSGLNISDYDLKIKKYVNQISSGRGHGFILKYYQYLAVLFTEMYLEMFFNDMSKGKREFVDKINNFINEINREGSSKFSSKDFKLPKLAYYMATGSGKTIVMHINYLQFIDHAQKSGIRIDNCVLITPSEHMTKQHLEELKKSGIDAIEFSGLTLDTYSANNFMVKVIDINKLKEESKKKGTGVSIDISAFGSHNLIIVDEGHKGYRSNERTWANIRSAMSSEGFALEYSATFEQAVSSDPELYDAYSHAIIIDYSYRHFYKDGYGKDFFIINLEKTPMDELDTRHTLLLANSLSFLDQLLVYKEKPEVMKKYRVDRPLWIFVGSKVKVSDQATTSDIIDVVEFLDWVFSPSNKSIVIEKIKAILKGNSGIQDDKGNDIFSQEYDERLFPYKIRSSNDVEEQIDSYGIYDDLLSLVFNCKGQSSIELYKITETVGEVGLKSGSDYFGVIDVGNRNEFLSGLIQKLPQIKVHDDKMTSSLFNSISENPEKINILIGAKKFIEGWDTKRVSSMCLLNIGKSEGAQIIQLFGRGVRLNGYNDSMKREVNPSKELKSVQTLYIYGVKAAYLRTFRDIVKQETLFIQRNIKITNKTNSIDPPLEIINLNDENFKNFKNEPIDLVYESDIIPEVNLLATAETVSSNESVIRSVSQYNACKLDASKLEVVNWNKIYFRILDYKFDSDLCNLIISTKNFDNLKESLFYRDNSAYELFMDPKLYSELDLDKIELIEDSIFEVIKRYVIMFNDKKFRESMNKGKKIFEIKKFTGPIPENYMLYVDEDVVNKFNLPTTITIKNLYYNKYNSLLPISEVVTIYDKRELSLYVPLISYNDSDRFYTIPIGLNVGERKFVEDFISFLKSKKNINGIELSTLEFYLYRNPSRLGYHFYVLNESVYPDFVLWVKRNKDGVKTQSIAYIEPHGLVHSDPGNDPKLNLPNYLKSIGNKIMQIDVQAFIISVTKRSDLKWISRNQNKPEEMGIVFQNESNYIKKILESIVPK